MKNFFIVIFLFILLQGIYQGFTTVAKELDSLMYHIPIAKAYLTGDIFTSPQSPILHRFFPGASESILAVFLQLHIPLNLYNVLGYVLLCTVLYFLGKRSGLISDQAIIFSIGFSTLTAITRWFNTQIVDIYLAVWYAWALFLLIKPQKHARYVIQLGSAMGLLIGTKYSGPFFAAILLVVFWEKLKKYISLKNILLFIIPVSVFGLFWYIRNWLVKGNPFYPLGFLSFPGVANWALEEPVYLAFFHNPGSMMSAFVSEYLGWSLILIVCFIYLIYSWVTGRRSFIQTLITMGFCNLGVYLLLPNGSSYTVHVSNLRYMMPVMIPLLLCVFLYAKEKRLFGAILYIAFTNIVFSLQFPYHPKLIFILGILLVMVQLGFRLMK